MEPADTSHSVMDMSDSEVPEFLYYNYSSDDEEETALKDDKKCDATATNEESVEISLDAEEYNILQQLASNKPDINANNKQPILSSIELYFNEISKGIFAPENAQRRVDRATQTDRIPSPIHSILVDDEDDNEENVNSNVIAIKTAADAPVQRQQRNHVNVAATSRNSNKKQQSIHAVTTPTKRYKCDRCDFSSKKKWDFDRHYQKHTGERPFECEYCERRFARKAHLDHHTKTIHKALFAFQCSKCRQGFSQEESWTSHEMLCSKKQHVCHFCDKQFDHKGHLNAHVRCHTDERPFKCPVCQKGFNSNSHVKRHVECCH